MPDILWLDYESQSECDLVKHGASNYAQDSSTKMLCCAYAFDDEEVQLWWAHEPVPQRLADYFRNGGQIRAHNEEFDRLLTWYVVCPDYGLPEPTLERWYCTATQARANCAPGSLEDVGRFAGADLRKDHRGAQLVRMCCMPPFSKDPKVLAELGEYAMQDVRAMRAISKAMRELSPQELADYHVNARINMRGVLVDLDLCKTAQRYASDEVEDIEAQVREITEGELTSVRSPKMRAWVWDRVGPQARKLMTLHKDGEQKQSIDKSVRAALISLAEAEAKRERYDEVPPHVLEVIRCADALWASAVAKFKRMAELADIEDRRVRGAFVFAGGSATGRASSYGLQAHNLPRTVAKDPEGVRQAMVRGHQIVPRFGERITDVLKGMLRPAMIPAPGKSFVVADWSAIEGRVNPWLSNCPAGEQKLDVFRSGLDPYRVNAQATFGVAYKEVTDDQRQVGKVQELALGFLGGPGSFATFGKIYRVHLSEAEVERAIRTWRRANSWAIKHGQDLERAYMSALRHPGHEFAAGRVVYLFDRQHLWYCLPSSRVLCYPYARLEEDGVSYAKAAWKPAKDAKEWPRGRLWRGLAVENVTQATANDILRAALRQLDDVVLHVHDEIVVETDQPEETLATMRRVMTTPPEWAAGLPLDIGIKVMTRYGK